MRILLSLFLAIIFFAQSALADNVVLGAGTKVSLILPNSISSESIEHDGTITAIVHKDVMVNNKVVFQKGDKAVLTVEETRRTGRLGRAGKIIINGGFVEDTHNERHPINFSYRSEGKSRRGVSIAYAVLSVPLIMFIVGLVTLPVAISMKGKEATMQGGMVFDVFTTSSAISQLPGADSAAVGKHL